MTNSRVLSVEPSFTITHSKFLSVCFNKLSYKRGNITISEFRDAYRLITEDYKFSLQIPDIDSKEVLNVTKSDKKMENGKIKFILLKSIGEAYIDTTVTDEEILESIDVIKKNDWSFLNE